MEKNKPFNFPNMEYWILNIKKVRNDNTGRPFVDKEFSMEQVFNIDLSQPDEKCLELTLRKFYNELMARGEFLEK